MVQKSGCKKLGICKWFPEWPRKKCVIDNQEITESDLPNLYSGRTIILPHDENVFDSGILTLLFKVIVMKLINQN